MPYVKNGLVYINAEEVRKCKEDGITDIIMVCDTVVGIYEEYPIYVKENENFEVIKKEYDNVGKRKILATLKMRYKD